MDCMWEELSIWEDVLLGLKLIVLVDEVLVSHKKHLAYSVQQASLWVEVWDMDEVEVE
jgi:hypothetical protein